MSAKLLWREKVSLTFLHNRGYYEYIRAYTNEPNLAYLKTFWKPGAFTKFSKERYEEKVRREGNVAAWTQMAN